MREPNVYPRRFSCCEYVTMQRRMTHTTLIGDSKVDRISCFRHSSSMLLAKMDATRAEPQPIAQGKILPPKSPSPMRAEMLHVSAEDVDARLTIAVDGKHDFRKRNIFLSIRCFVGCVKINSVLLTSMVEFHPPKSALAREGRSQIRIHAYVSPQNYCYSFWCVYGFRFPCSSQRGWT